jgi:hypothetical protein
MSRATRSAAACQLTAEHGGLGYKWPPRVCALCCCKWAERSMHLHVQHTTQMTDLQAMLGATADLLSVIRCTQHER